MRYESCEVNLHTHSYYCGHGSGELWDFERQAVSDGHLKVLGFSEHIPLPLDDLPSRMPFSERDNYLDDVMKVRKQSSLRILSGFECDFDPKYVPYYNEVSQMTDYLLGSVHFLKDSNGDVRYIGRIEMTQSVMDRYTDLYIGMLESDLFLYGCHPDVFLYRCTWSDMAARYAEKIIDTAVKYDRVLEINGQGMRKKLVNPDGSTRNPYPVREFWCMAREKGVRICCASDAHEPQFVYEQKCFDFARENSIDLIGWDL